MKNSIILLAVMLCSGCATLPADIPNASQSQAEAVVLDIDGTLTPRPMKIWEPRRDAAKAVHGFADRNYRIIYLSARIKPFRATIPDWLKKEGFPAGSVYVPETAEDDRDPVYFKTRILRAVIAHGWTVALAYGDSSTDFEAYAAAGIPKERIFALRREGAASCQPGAWEACLNGWTELMAPIAK